MNDVELYALREGLLLDPDARVRSDAAERLRVALDARAVSWLTDALADPKPSVRDAAVRSIARLSRALDAKPARECLRDMALRETVWWVRRSTALALAVVAGEDAIETLCSVLGDPFWRVRYAAVQALAAFGDESPSLRRRILGAPYDAPYPADERARSAALAFLEARWSGVPCELRPVEECAASSELGALADPDPAVVKARLEKLGPDEADGRALAALLGESHEPLRALAARRILSKPEEPTLELVARWLDDPRHPHGPETARALLQALGRAPREPAWTPALPESEAGRAHGRARDLEERLRAGSLPDAERLAALSDGDPWVRAAVLDERSALLVLESDEDPALRRSAATMLAHSVKRLAFEGRTRAAELAVASDDASIRACAPLLLGTGPDSLATLLELSRDRELAVRAAAVDELDADPRLGESIHALLAKGASESATIAALTCLWRSGGLDAARALVAASPAVAEHLAALALADAPASSLERSAIKRSREPRPERPRAIVERRALGATGLDVAPLAISGVGELPVGAHAEALDAGVDLFFWEPRYRTLSRFLRSRRARRARVIAGTFHGDAPSIEKDIETALRRLRRETIDVFLIFWVRSRERLSEEIRACLNRAKAAGKVRAIGFSTHFRDLAAAAISEVPWDVVMFRHSAAHPGAEREVFPRARAKGTAVFTFSNTCYGRLLRTTSAGDCYRYSLSQPGVVACVSAPRDASELRQNLAVLTDSRLDAARCAALREQGARVRADNQLFHALVRGGGREQVAALLEEPLDELTHPRGRGRASDPPAALRRGRP